MVAFPLRSASLLALLLLVAPYAQAVDVPRLEVTDADGDAPPTLDVRSVRLDLAPATAFTLFYFTVDGLSVDQPRVLYEYHFRVGDDTLVDWVCPLVGDGEYLWAPDGESCTLTSTTGGVRSTADALAPRPVSGVLDRRLVQRPLAQAEGAARASRTLPAMMLFSPEEGLLGFEMDSADLGAAGDVVTFLGGSARQCLVADLTGCTVDYVAGGPAAAIPDWT